MERLFVYGSLQPGGPNEHVLAAIGGDWQPAVIRGRLVESGWGASLGYPGPVPDDNGEDVPGHLFSSPDLAAAWASLDEMEGAEYERRLAFITLAGGQRLQAHVYVLREA
jgi:gamma-glutamylcyclotransferase (GGCT)/AIG2-like uncharacterized protein YtfP